MSQSSQNDIYYYQNKRGNDRAHHHEQCNKLWLIDPQANGDKCVITQITKFYFDATYALMVLLRPAHISFCYYKFKSVPQFIIIVLSTVGFFLEMFMYVYPWSFQCNYEMELHIIFVFCKLVWGCLKVQG